MDGNANQSIHANPVLHSGEGASGSIGSIGVRFMVSGAQSGGGFSLVEHPMPPHALGAPLHRHSREDEYSVVLSGRVAAELGGEIVHGGPGDLIFKPRGQWHTFWNEGDEPASVLEIISPAGLETFFEKLAEMIRNGAPDPARVVALSAEYGMENDMSAVPRLVAEHGLHFPGVG